jgi:hypothetical protein
LRSRSCFFVLFCPQATWAGCANPIIATTLRRANTPQAGFSQSEYHMSPPLSQTLPFICVFVGDARSVPGIEQYFFVISSLGVSAQAAVDVGLESCISSVRCSSTSFPRLQPRLATCLHQRFHTEQRRAEPAGNADQSRKLLLWSFCGPGAAQCHSWGVLQLGVLAAPVGEIDLQTNVRSLTSGYDTRREVSGDC